MTKFKLPTSHRPHSPKHEPHVPTLTIHIPAYGVIYVSRPPPLPTLTPGTPVEGPELPPDEAPIEVRGELEIYIPRGHGGRRARGVRISLRSRTTFDLSPERHHEEDEIFRRETKLDGGGEGLWLEEGSHRFEFTLLLPCTLAPHDWHPGVALTHTLHAELEGLPLPESSSSKHGGGHGWLPFRSRSTSPGMTPKRKGSSLNTKIDAHDMSFVRATESQPLSPEWDGGNPPLFPRAPSYEQSQAEAHGEGAGSGAGAVAGGGNGEGSQKWLEGVWKTRRIIKICRNPHPDGGISELDAVMTDFVDGWGRYEHVLTCNVLTVGCRLRASLIIPDPSPGLTIFAMRISLCQTITLHSPRDKGKGVPPVVRKKTFTILQKGHSMDPNMRRPGRDYASIWRGKGAHGKDEGEVEIRAKGRMPNDQEARPSTIQGTTTPLVVTHTIISEVFFSVWGEDARGQAIPAGGPGMLRVMSVTRPIVLPACPIIPQTLDLPPYDTHPTDNLPTTNPPCSLCHTPISQKLCSTCPPGPPHVRHDHDPKLVGNPEGVCPQCCGGDIMPSGEVGTRNCMCALNEDELDVLEKNESWMMASRHAGPLAALDAVEGGGGGQGVVGSGVNGKYEFRRGRMAV